MEKWSYIVANVPNMSIQCSVVSSRLIFTTNVHNWKCNIWLYLSRIATTIFGIYFLYKMYMKVHTYMRFISYYSDECDLLSIWDDMQPSYRKYPQFCSELAHKNIPSFLKVFSNDFYGIIKMFSQSVQINLKPSKMPEKVM